MSDGEAVDLCATCGSPLCAVIGVLGGLACPTCVSIDMMPITALQQTFTFINGNADYAASMRGFSECSIEELTDHEPGQLPPLRSVFDRIWEIQLYDIGGVVKQFQCFFATYVKATNAWRVQPDIFDNCQVCGLYIENGRCPDCGPVNDECWPTGEEDEEPEDDGAGYLSDEEDVEEDYKKQGD